MKQIARLATGANDCPFNPPKIVHVKIIDPRHPAAPAKKTITPTHKSTTGTATPKKSTPPQTQQ